MDIARINTYIEHLKKSIDANMKELNRTKDESINQLMKGMIHDKSAIIEALERQLPRKTVASVLDKDKKVGAGIFRAGITIYSCQCGSWIGYRDTFCKHCGQKLDWRG